MTISKLFLLNVKRLMSEYLMRQIFMRTQGSLYMKHYDYLIVGAGLFGAVFAHEAQRAGKNVLVIDKRPQIGGNVYTEDIEGIHVHLSVKFYSVGEFSRNNKRGKPPLEWKCYNFRGKE